MTRVSKRLIKDSEFKKVFDKFIDILYLSKSKKETFLFIREFFSPTERIMFAKRIGIICMVIDEIPDRTIADSLSVSTSTVGRVIEKYEKGEYKYLSSLIKNNKEGLLDLLEQIYFIIPPKVGRKRYRFVRQGKFNI